MFVVLLGLSSSLSNPSIQASLTNSQLHSSLSNPSIHTSLRLSSLSNPPPTGMASSPRRRPAPISPLTLSPGGDQRRSLSKQLSPTMSPSLSPITQVRKCLLKLFIQHLVFSSGIFTQSSYKTSLLVINWLQGSRVHLMLLDFSGLLIMHYHFLLWMLKGKHSNMWWYITSNWSTQHKPIIYTPWVSLWIAPHWSVLTLQWFVTDFFVEIRWLPCATL